ncbi:hypothetical protein HMPREF9453_00209 [Dialister succinatiphilus YIT 11850]|uniref:Uncharacterized protein n=1 Tax=Dialister succinatiphilus YIT 11850 TaxID=742743 RepID=H1CXX1_9FIRM|nr:hypothetical protein HMPREF9453_00209 [Dialister succinatiphilus YIT 11850]
MMRLSDFRLAVRLGTYTPPMTGILCEEISRLRFARNDGERDLGCTLTVEEKDGFES